ncbi:MAG: ATP-binding protein [Leptolyngbya sp.]|nr:ATP-binding protein [Candidatus Melainabacteria bacterium]
MVNLFASTEDIFIECSIDEDLQIIGEIDEICRVIENLLSNAIKFSISGSTINLSARKVTNEVLISIQDRGPGIPESEIPMLFKRFWQGQSGKRTASSTGLGLYTCRQIVEAHNGKIWCENVPEVGAKFSIRLPAI